MSIWKVLLIWLAAFAGTGCLGLLLVVFLTTVREADEQTAKKNPPQPPQPKSWQYWATFILIYAAGTTLLNHLPTRVLWTLMIVGGSVIATVLIRCVVIGWRTQQDAHFFAKAAAICVVVAASSGYAIWRFN